MIDTHTHSKFSHDGHQRIATMVDRAKKLGIKYLAITNHCDWDYLKIEGYEHFQQIDLYAYLKEIEKQLLAAEGIELAIGLELGFHSLATETYLKRIPFERFDYIINSVHSIENHDVYFLAYFVGKERQEAYLKYLKGVYESISAPYPYSTIGHIGYIAKNSIYENKSLLYSDFTDILDMILKAIIEKDKTVELNSNIRTDICMPNISILKRYKELGGDNITYGSDAHKLKRLGEGYNEVKELAQSLGYKYWTVYKKMEPLKVKI